MAAYSTCLWPFRSCIAAVAVHFFAGGDITLAEQPWRLTSLLVAASRLQSRSGSSLHLLVASLLLQRCRGSLSTMADTCGLQNRLAGTLEVNGEFSVPWPRTDSQGLQSRVDEALEVNCGFTVPRPQADTCGLRSRLAEALEVNGGFSVPRPRTAGHGLQSSVA